VQDRGNISDVASKLLAQFGPDFTFVSDGPAVHHYGFAVLRWQAGPRGGERRHIDTTFAAEDAANGVPGGAVRQAIAPLRH
jgi:hypothetical protein